MEQLYPIAMDITGGICLPFPGNCLADKQEAPHQLILGIENSVSGRVPLTVCMAILERSTQTSIGTVLFALLQRLRAYKNDHGVNFRQILVDFSIPEINVQCHRGCVKEAFG